MSLQERRRQRGVTLIELLVAIVIMGVLSTMIIGSWIALTDAYSSTSRANRQRDAANFAIARMAREIRDAQKLTGAGGEAIVMARADEIRFYSTFNTGTAADPTARPRLTRFILRETDPTSHVATVYRELAGDDGAFDAVPGGDDVSTVLVRDVVDVRSLTDLFVYSGINSTTGVMYQSVESTATPVLMPASRVQTVRITLHVDLNPGKSPNYMDISTTVEPRNMRHL